MGRMPFAVRLAKAPEDTTRCATNYSSSPASLTPLLSVKYLGFLTLRRAFALLTSLHAQFNHPYLLHSTLVLRHHTRPMPAPTAAKLCGVARFGTMLITSGIYLNRASSTSRSSGLAGAANTKTPLVSFDGLPASLHADEEAVMTLF